MLEFGLVEVKPEFEYGYASTPVIVDPSGVVNTKTIWLTVSIDTGCKPEPKVRLLSVTGAGGVENAKEELLRV